MSALRQPIFPAKSSPHRQRSRRKKRSAGYHPKANNNHQRISTVTSAAKNFSPQKLPVKLQVLLLLQRGSFGLALISMAASVGLYISTVRIPQLWSQEYKNLETLQRQERQLTAINETLKYQLAKEAGQQNKKSNLAEANNTIFLTPKEVKVAHKSDRVTSDRQILLEHTSFGY